MPWSGGNAEGPAPPRRKIRKNSSTFGKFVAVAYLPKVLLSAMHYRRGCGLSRRFAPRNGSGETSLPPQTRHRFLHVIANQCAHLRQSASCGDTLQIGCCFGEFVTPYGFAQSITFRFVQPPRRLSKTPRKKPGPQMGSRPALWISWRPGSSTDR